MINLRDETFITAVHILDRYRIKRDLDSNPPESKKLTQLAYVCFTLASGILEPINFHYSSLIIMFESNYPVDLKETVQLERDVLIALDFDFNYPCFLDFIDMFLTIL